MFDTSIVRARAAAGPYRVTLMTASLAIHSCAILAAISLSVASTNFPVEAPPQMEIFRAVSLPSSPPPPLGPPQKPHEADTPKPQLVPKPQEITAPREVPNDTPQLEPPSSTVTAQSSGLPGPGSGEGPIGDPNGKPGGVGEGPGGGGGGGTGIYEPGGAVISARVLTRVQPLFPPSMIRAVRTATVVVLCVIDKEGKIRDPRIVMSSFPPLNQAVLDALQQWTFAPGSLRGRPVDTYFELRVKFEVR